MKEFSIYDGNIKQVYFGSAQQVVNKWRIKLSGAGVKNLKEEMIESFVLVGDYIVQ